MKNEQRIKRNRRELLEMFESYCPKIKEPKEMRRLRRKLKDDGIKVTYLSLLVFSNKSGRKAKVIQLRSDTSQSIKFLG